MIISFHLEKAKRSMQVKVGFAAWLKKKTTILFTNLKKVYKKTE